MLLSVGTDFAPVGTEPVYVAVVMLDDALARVAVTRRTVAGEELCHGLAVEDRRVEVERPRSRSRCVTCVTVRRCFRITAMTILAR